MPSTDEDDYCKDKACPDGSNLYYATLYESDKNKQLIYSLFALHYEVFDCLTVSPDPGVTRLKLHWWQEEIDRLRRNEPRHPVTCSLALIVSDHSFIHEHLVEHFKTIESIACGETMNDIVGWKNQLFTGLGRIWQCAAKLSGQSVTDSTIITNGGTIFTLDLLQIINSLYAKAYYFLPTELLDQFDVDKFNLIDTKNTKSTNLVITELMLQIQQQLDSSYTELKDQKPKPALYNAIMNQLSATLCREIQLDGYRLLQHKISITPLRKLWIATRTKFRF